jgi:hypothetical protein
MRIADMFARDRPRVRHDLCMSDLERRRGGRMNRQQRVDRAYRLTVATGVFGTIAVAALVLSIVGVVGGGWWVIAAIVAVVCFIALRGTVRGGR